MSWAAGNFVLRDGESMWCYLKFYHCEGGYCSGPGVDVGAQFMMAHPNNAGVGVAVDHITKYRDPNTNQYTYCCFVTNNGGGDVSFSLIGGGVI